MSWWKRSAGTPWHPLGAHALLHAVDPSAYAEGLFPLNSAFSIARGLRSCSVKVGGKLCPLVERFELQMARYRAEPLFGWLENKILVKSALRAIGLPFVAPVFAGLAGGGVGPWRKYHRQDLREALSRVRAHPHHVIKPATDGGSTGVRLLRSSRGWTVAGLVDEAEKHLWHELKHWGQRYGWNGVLLEPLYGSGWASAVLELKSQVAWGVPVCVRTRPLGAHLTSYAGRFTLVRGVPAAGTNFSCVSGSAQCREFARRLNAPGALRKLDDWAMRAALWFGADWYRLDVLTGLRSGSFAQPGRQREWLASWTVNELTYPSGDGSQSHTGGCAPAWDHLTRIYASAERGSGAFATVPADAALRKMAAEAELSADRLLAEPHQGRKYSTDNDE